MCAHKKSFGRTISHPLSGSSPMHHCRPELLFLQGFNKVFTHCVHHPGSSRAVLFICDAGPGEFHLCAHTKKCCRAHKEMLPTVHTKKCFRTTLRCPLAGLFISGGQPDNLINSCQLAQSIFLCAHTKNALGAP